MSHVLVVEDDAVIRSMLQRFLEMGGYTVTVAQDGQDALEQLDNIQADLVLTDLEMPVMGGRELLDSIRLLHPEVRVMGMSGNASRYPGLSEQFDGFVSKPFNLDVLIRTLADSLALETSN